MSSNPNTDPLDELFVDSQPLDKALLAAIILPYVRLIADTAEVVLLPEWRKLSLSKQILIYLLGQKVLRVRGIISDQEERLSPSEIEERTEIKGNSLRPTLSKLLDEKLVRADEERRYFVPDYALQQIDDLMK